MKFVADLHVHSRFSRATARNLDLEHLYIAAQLKGITVVGTGDFTHPGWFAELTDKLVPAEPGLFRLTDELAGSCNNQVPGACRRPVRFILSTEISNIYKKDDQTRKNHNLVFMPDLEATRRFITTLDNIGNLHSDGRPILGLDARDLLEIVLEVEDQGFLVPAHIWTPWFSLLGSKSGFDSIEQCFEDLSEFIFAVETGLSSDPPMNWRVSQLDGRTLISNSDAHSPQKLGREANLFDTDLSYFSIHRALMSGDPKKFLGTIEFFPEEGKYHLDGHRKCGLRIHPRDTGKLKGNCPICGRQLTLGVLHRVEQLADRLEGFQPETFHPYVHRIPLVEILADLLGVGPGSKKVRMAYNQLLEKFGSEDSILRSIDTDILDNAAGMPLLGEAIRRVRDKRVVVLPGFDGEFGKIRIFDAGERKILRGQKTLFAQKPKRPKKNRSNDANRKKKKRDPTTVNTVRQSKKKNQPSKLFGKSHADLLFDPLNNQQRRAMMHTEGPLLIVAGPGTGKTRTLTHRIAYLISHRKADPSRILAVTFTHKAARQMYERLRVLLGSSSSLPDVATFHSLCMQILKECRPDKPFRVIDEPERLEWVRRAAAINKDDSSSGASGLAQVAHRIVTAKQHLLTAEDLAAQGNHETAEAARVYRRYQHLLEMQNLFDFEDLIFNGIQLLESEDQRAVQQRYAQVLVDEYQDLNFGQYRLVKALANSGAALFVIGYPDQAIYGFRGSDVRFFHQFMKDFPKADTIHLATNYRSSQTILDASRQMMTATAGDKERRRIYSGIKGVPTVGIIEAASEKSEAVAVGKSIEQLLGGIGFYSMDFGRVNERSERKAFGFADMAVLSRTARQGELLAEWLMAAGIPCQLTTARQQLQDSGLQAALAVVRLLEGVGSYLDLETAIPYLNDGLKPREIKRITRWGMDNNCSIHQVLETAKRLPLPGWEKHSQRKIFDLIRQLEKYRHELQALPMQNKLKSLARKLSLPALDETAESLSVLEDHRHRVAASRPDPVDLISRISLQTDTDRYNHRVEKVTLLTMHAAKGLEFPVVFVTGCEDNLIPFRLPKKEENDIDEERRLFYVAMTRAKELLFLTHCRKRKVFGRTEIRYPSPFLVDIENRLKSFEKSPSSRFHPPPEQLQLF